VHDVNIARDDKGMWTLVIEYWWVRKKR